LSGVYGGVRAFPCTSGVAMMWSVTGALLLGVAVLVGAFGAHALRERLDPYRTGIYERAVFYHFVHAIGLLAIGIAVRTASASTAPALLAGWLLLAGIVVFCGSLYALALTGMRALGAITPLGGLAFVAGWFTFAYALTVR
jgi:uncharacterized membrane protein YgdD (TMEM256/DUF423 family)